MDVPSRSTRGARVGISRVTLSEQADLSEIPEEEGQPLRRAEESDTEAIAAVANAVSERLYGEAVVSAEEIRRWFAYAGLEIRVVEMNGEIVGYMDVERRAGGRILVDVCVHPDAWESATASTLIGAAEAWARAHAREGDFLRAWAFEREDYLRRALDERGYRFIRHHLFMLIELRREPPEPKWPDGILVRRFRPADARAVYEADVEAFSDHWDFQPEPFALWRERTVERDDFDPSLWLIAWDGEDVAGYSLNSWHASGDPTYGWIHVLGVRRPWRRRGLGSALLRASFSEFARRGAMRVGLAVDAENLTGAVALYEHVGMRAVRRYDIYEKLLSSGLASKPRRGRCQRRCRIVALYRKSDRWRQLDTSGTTAILSRRAD
jgi:mycothiol synthase